jgi:hypothetical protein
MERQSGIYKDFGAVEVDVWEPVPGKPGYVRRKEYRLLRDIQEELTAQLQLHLPEDFNHVEYFSPGDMTGNEKDRRWPSAGRHTAVFTVEGGNEGHYVHVEVLMPDDKPPARCFLIKTFGGWESALRLSNAITVLLLNH